MDIKAILEKDKTIFSEIRNYNNAEEIIKICHDRDIYMTQEEAIEILSAITHNHDCHNSSEYKHQIVKLSDAELESVAGGKGGTITSGWLTAYCEVCKCRTQQYKYYETYGSEGYFAIMQCASCNNIIGGYVQGPE